MRNHLIKILLEIEKSSALCLRWSSWNYVFFEKLNDNRLELIY